MPRALPISGEYPPDWQQISNDVWAAAGHRCIRCGHPYRKGEHGKGEWSPCDEGCRHHGPCGVLFSNGHQDPPHELDRVAGNVVKAFQASGSGILMAHWRIGTVHHFDGNKANCEWYNLMALCQRCHLTIQSRVNPSQPYWLEHSEWMKPYVAGFYAKKYEGRTITREQAMAEMEKLLAYERLA